MSIERSQPGSSVVSTQRPDADGSSRARREPPAAENVDRFRNLMQARDGARHAPGDAAQGSRPECPDARQASQETHSSAQRHAVPAMAERGAQRDQWWRFAPQEELPSAEAAALSQAQLVPRDGIPMPAAAAPQVNPSAFAEMVERHVRQMAVSAGGAGDGDGQVLLRLSDDTLPGTDLLLTRTADGWSLRADVRSRGSFDAIRDAAPQLAERFAARNLGRLSIDPHFIG